MASLSDPLRRQLEKAVVAARDVAEAGARAALERLAVRRSQPFGEMAAAERELRVRLRAHARQLGDPREENGEQGIERLVAECAYEQWHRMLFARFLAENRLLIHPEHGVPVTLTECEELAVAVGGEDGWALAGRFAARMLPAIFRPGDPVLHVRLAAEHQQPLEKLLAGLPPEVFTADDSFGWVYQFWQTKRKDEVNASGKKIGADEVPAVTQLFTEPYMVKFLLHNTVGAWWAGKVLAGLPQLAEMARSEDELRSQCAFPGCAWTYLRFIRMEVSGPWRPAAGTFGTWPRRAGELTVLDPCCGSGHFLVEAFRILVPLRMAEERLSAREACDAVLSDNIFGLEIDERCTQIAAFNLALAAWTYPDAGGYRPLPELHIACSGLSVGAKEEEWLKPAAKDEHLREGMRRLYALFRNAPTLGSLINPRREVEARPSELELDKGRFDNLRPLLEQALSREEVKRDAQATEAGIAAQGMAKAAALLAGAHTLVVTNVPYVGRGKQDDILKAHLEKHYKVGKADLATAFVLRCLDFCAEEGSTALVTPHNWLFLSTYRKLREDLLKHQTLNMVARLGTNAFQDMNWWAATTSLLILSRSKSSDDNTVTGIDVSADKQQDSKAAMLRGQRPADMSVVSQSEQLKNPDATITLVRAGSVRYLREFARSYQGLTTGDDPRLKRQFWEVDSFARAGSSWRLLQGPSSGMGPFAGREDAVDSGLLHGRIVSGAIRGREAWGHCGVAIDRVGALAAAFYNGDLYHSLIPVLVPHTAENLPALGAFCFSPDLRAAARASNQALSIDNGYFEKLPFDLAHWRRVAAEKYPQGLPEPQSNDPTQWLFHGHPAGMVAAGPASASPFGIGDPIGADRHVSLISRTPNAAAVLQVAIGRLLGYRWPTELDPDMRLDIAARRWVERCGDLPGRAAADDDDIVCIPPVRGGQPTADRLQGLLAAGFGEAWTPGTLPALLEHAGFRGKTLDDWLRDGFFEEHCQLFHQRPFVWHIWDGRRRDGFAALVNYHTFERKHLERLTYALLGDWITVQRHGAKAGAHGAEDRLAAAEALQKKLALILEGEPPHDIFVRWKPIEQQPIGWEPDLNAGVRMNIRPFVEAGVLRKNPRINWNKDRGAEPESLRPREQFPWFWKDDRFTGERVNDVHLTNAGKRAARERAAKEQSTGR